MFSDAMVSAAAQLLGFSGSEPQSQYWHPNPQQNQPACGPLFGGINGSKPKVDNLPTKWGEAEDAEIIESKA